VWTLRAPAICAYDTHGPPFFPQVKENPPYPAQVLTQNAPTPKYRRCIMSVLALLIG
jgi:hypothetical protein